MVAIWLRSPHSAKKVRMKDCISISYGLLVAASLESTKLKSNSISLLQDEDPSELPREHENPSMHQIALACCSHGKHKTKVK
jgi:hypothetical protein